MTGVGGQTPDPASWQVWKIAPNGTASVFVQGAPLRQPNGVAIDGQGNVVVLNMGTDEILTFSPPAQLLKTEKAAQAGNDGIVIMPDGTKYISSVQNGGVSRIRPGQPAELIASNIPSAASMCYDAGRQPAGDPDEPEQRARVRAAAEVARASRTATRTARAPHRFASRLLLRPAAASPPRACCRRGSG